MSTEPVVTKARRRDRVDVLVLVKATPQPSTRYGDTVCVAGVVLDDGPPRWIRLYPVPFRYLAADVQFKKYMKINVALREARGDLRPESAKIDVESIRCGDVVIGWKHRAPHVDPLVGPTMCEMLAAVCENPNAASLGVIRARRVAPDLEFAAHAPWAPEQLAKLTAAAAQDSLFGETRVRLLEPPRFVVRLRYWCRTESCGGHLQRIIDWELTALQGRLRDRSDGAVRQAIQDRFMKQPFLRDTDPLIYVGNQESPQRRRSFTVLGLYYPQIGEADPGLF